MFMFLKYLPANQCWAFTVGDQLVSMDYDDGTVGPRLFPSKVDALDAAKRCGLAVAKSGQVYIPEAGVH